MGFGFCDENDRYKINFVIVLFYNIGLNLIFIFIDEVIKNMMYVIIYYWVCFKFNV